MTSTPQHSPQYVFGPRPEPSVILGLRPGQVVVISWALALALGVLATVAPPANVPAAIALAAAAAAVGFVPVGGRTVEQWIPVGAQWALRRLTGRTRWRSTAPTAGHSVDGEVAADVPPSLAGVEVYGVEVAGGQLGVAHERAGDAFTALLEVEGDALVLLDSGEQRQRLAAWAEVLRGFGGEASPISRLQWIERSAPDDGDELGRDLRERHTAPAGSAELASYLDLLDEAAPTVRHHDVYLAVQVTSRRAARLLRGVRGRDERRQAAGAILADQLARLDRRLARAGLRVVAGGLGPRRLAEVLRVAGDPAAQGALARRGLHHADQAGADPAHPWPVAADETWQAWHTDSAWHATYWVAEWPRTPVGPDFLAPLLLDPQATRTVSVVMQPVGQGAAVRAAEAARTTQHAERELRERKGFITSWRKRREAEGVERRAAELQEGNAEFRFSGYVTVSAADPQALADACAAVDQAAQQSGLDLRRLAGEQDLAWTYTLPLARGLR